MFALVVATAALAVGGGQAEYGPPRCQTPECHKRVERRNHRRKWRGKPWQHRYHHLPRVAKTKLRLLRYCESTDNPAAVNDVGPFYGYYQYMASTARTAGFRTLPNKLTNREGRAEQHVRTWRYIKMVGGSPWPVCRHKAGL